MKTAKVLKPPSLHSRRNPNSRSTRFRKKKKTMNPERDLLIVQRKIMNNNGTITKQEKKKKTQDWRATERTWNCLKAVRTKVCFVSKVRRERCSFLYIWGAVFGNPVLCNFLLFQFYPFLFFFFFPFSHRLFFFFFRRKLKK